MIFAAPQLQEKCQQMSTHFYSTLVDLTKDFDMVNRDRRWKIKQKLVCPERFTQMVSTATTTTTTITTTPTTTTAVITINAGSDERETQGTTEGVTLGRRNDPLQKKAEFGFRRHRRTTDMIVAAPQLQEKCQEMPTHFYTTLVDLTKDFDMVNRDRR
nr:unnamed protein product [Spirometra erinaceieuropaei]